MCEESHDFALTGNRGLPPPHGANGEEKVRKSALVGRRSSLVRINVVVQGIPTDGRT